jgi:integrase
VTDESITINRVMLEFLKANRNRYETRGKKKSAQESNFLAVIKVVRLTCGSLPAKEFTGKMLRDCRRAMIAKGWTRRHITKQTNRVRQMFAWGVLEGLVPPDVIHSLKCLPALKPGEDGVRERPKVKPVAEDLVRRCLPSMQKPIAAMVELMLWTGARSGEIVLLRPCDLDRSSLVWIHRPHYHKGEKAGKERNILIGPEGQRILTPWLEGCGEEYVFSPAKAETVRLAERAANRKSPRWPSHMKRNTAKRVGARRKRKPGRRYDVDAFRRAVAYGISKTDREARKARDKVLRESGELKQGEKTPYTVKKHERIVPPWHPHQLRHTAATRLRKQYGIEMARVILGHSSIEVSELYAEIDLEAAKEVMNKSG